MPGRRIGTALILGLAVYVGVKILFATAPPAPKIGSTQAPTEVREESQTPDSPAESSATQRAQTLNFAAGFANSLKGKMIDAQTESLGAEIEGDSVLHYKYRFPAMTLRDVDPGFRDKMTRLLTDRACRQMRPILELDASIRYSYVDREHQQIASTVIELADCEESGPIKAADNNIKVRLPAGLSLELPPSWEVFLPSERLALNETVNSVLDLSDLESNLSFASNLHDEHGSTIGILNVRYYPETAGDQSDVRNLTSREIEELDEALEETMRQSMDSMGTPVTYWSGTIRKELNGITALITEYRRSARLTSGDFRVRLVRVLAGDRSFTLTVSYLESSSELLAPMTERIIDSLRLTGV